MSDKAIVIGAGMTLIKGELTNVKSEQLYPKRRRMCVNCLKSLEKSGAKFETKGTILSGHCDWCGRAFYFNAPPIPTEEKPKGDTSG